MGNTVSAERPLAKGPGHVPGSLKTESCKTSIHSSAKDDRPVQDVVNDIHDEPDQNPEDAMQIIIRPDGRRPKGWNSWLHPRLDKVVADAKGAATEHLLKFIKRHLHGTKLIFVVGQGGTGKSTLLSEATGQDLVIGKTFASGTKEYQICPGIIDGEQYLFIDTAGFGAADVDDMDNFHNIISCLEALSPFVTVAGVLFVVGGTQPRLSKEDVRTIQWVKCFCGPSFYRNVTLVTTKWDAWSEDDFEENWTRMKKHLLADPLVAELLGDENGAGVYHHSIMGNEQKAERPQYRLSVKRSVPEREEQVRAMITERYGGAATEQGKPAKLQVVEEMERGIPWNETEAAKILLSGPDGCAQLEVVDGFVQIKVPREPEPEPEPEPEVEHDAQSVGVIENTSEEPTAATTTKDGQEEDEPAAAVTGLKDGVELTPLGDDEAGQKDVKAEQKSKWTPDHHDKTWTGSLFRWLNQAYKLAVFFKRSLARPRGAGSSGAATRSPERGLWRRTWDGVREVYFGH